MSSIPIFLASDDGCAPFVATTMASILCNTKSYVDFYVLVEKISVSNKRLIRALGDKFMNFSVEFIEVDAKNIFNGFFVKEHHHVTLIGYSRFLIPKLKPNINKAIYLDVDTIVLRDIVEFYNENLNGYIIGAIWEESLDESVNNILRKNIMQFSQSHKYFNSGVLLIDCQKWRENNIEEKLFSMDKMYPQRSTHDQDILNKCFDNNYQQLDKKYNYLNQDCFSLKANSDIVVRHFNGKIKPWHCDCCCNSDFEHKTIQPIKHFEEFWFFAKMTSFYEELWQNYEKSAENFKRKLRVAALIAAKRKEYAEKNV